MNSQKQNHQRIIEGFIRSLRLTDDETQEKTCLDAIQDYEKVYGNRDEMAMAFREQYRNTVIRNEMSRGQRGVMI